MELLAYLGAIVVVVIGWYYKRFYDINRLVKHIPGPPPIPIFGNGLLLAFNKPSELLKILLGLSKTYGGFFKLFFGPQLQVVVSNPADVEAILGSQKLIEKSDEYNFIAHWLGEGLLISGGRKWFARRKVITPTFHFKILEQFTEVFDKHSGIFVNNLSKFNGQKAAIDIFPHVTLCALDIICESAMGCEINAQVNSESVYVQAVKEISEIIAIRTFNLFLRNEFIFNLTPLGRRQKKVLKILHGFTDSVILARREQLSKEQKNNSIDEDEDNDIGAKKKMALLDVLLQATINGQPLTNLDIREEVDTFMFEGHDTTTSGIAFAIYNLAKNPIVQQKAFDEVRNVIGDDKNKPMTLKDLTELHYMDLVIKETLRLFPSVPMMARKVEEDVVINGKMVPKGTNVAVAPYFMGRSELIWPQAEEFRPERFDKNLNQTHPYASVPFSAGPRNCIGQKFAMLEMKSTISRTLRNFQLSVEKGYEPVLVSEIILRPENGIKIHLNERIYQ